MPMVNGMKFPYTVKGKAAAKKATAAAKPKPKATPKPKVTPKPKTKPKKKKEYIDATQREGFLYGKGTL